VDEVERPADRPCPERFWYDPERVDDRPEIPDLLREDPVMLVIGVDRGIHDLRAGIREEPDQGDVEVAPPASDTEDIDRSPESEPGDADMFQPVRECVPFGGDGLEEVETGGIFFVCQVPAVWSHGSLWYPTISLAKVIKVICDSGILFRMGHNVPDFDLMS